MKDIEGVLGQAYFDALDGNISFTDGESNVITVAIYDHIPNAPVYPYIQLGEFRSVEDGDKSQFGSTVLQEVKVVQKYEADYGGKDEVSGIVDDMIQIIRTRTPLDLTPNFNMITVTVDNSDTLDQFVDDSRLVQRITVFRHIIVEV